MCARSALRQDRRSFGFNGNNFHVGIFRFQKFSDARQSSAGADARDEDINIAVRVVPNFDARRVEMRLRVCGIGELRRNERVGNFCGKFFSFGNGAPHAVFAVSQNDFRAVSFEQLATFDAHCVGHGENRTITASRRETCQTDTRVAACRFDNHAVGLEFAVAFRMFNHCFGDAIFNGAGGVEVFELDEQPSVEFDGRRKIFRVKQRRVANQFSDA